MLKRKLDIEESGEKRLRLAESKELSLFANYCLKPLKSVANSFKRMVGSDRETKEMIENLQIKVKLFEEDSFLCQELLKAKVSQYQYTERQMIDVKDVSLSPVFPNIQKTDNFNTCKSPHLSKTNTKSFSVIPQTLTKIDSSNSPLHMNLNFAQVSICSTSFPKQQRHSTESSNPPLKPILEIDTHLPKVSLNFKKPQKIPDKLSVNSTQTLELDSITDVSTQKNEAKVILIESPEMKKKASKKPKRKKRNVSKDFD